MNFFKFKIIFLFVFCFSMINGALLAEQLPKGAALFIQTEKPGETYLALADMQTGKIVKMTKKFNNIMYPRYHHQKGLIGFTSKDRKMHSKVYLFSPKDRKLEKILDNAAFEGFSPDGNSLLYTECSSKGGLYMYNIASKESKCVSRKKVISASWSNDGKWIATSVITKSGKTDLVKISIPGFKHEKITDTAIINEAFPVFTKDGRYLVLFVGKDRDNRVAYYNIKTKKLTLTRIRGRNPSMSPDNRWIVFERKNKIFVCDKDGKNMTKIAKGKTPIWF